MPHRRRVRLTAPRLALGLALVAGSASASAEEVDFNRDVRPLLASRCFPCHGPDQSKRAAGLRLDRADGEDGAYRSRRGSTALRPGAAEDSEVWHRVSTEDPDLRMPPADSHAEPFDADELDVLRRWIAQGAEYQEHWAFLPPSPPPIPDEPASLGAIDRLVRARLDEEMPPAPRADDRSLIRRLSLDLTGLPPTREQIHAFLADDAPDALPRLVDRLLADPAHGEHMARYWLDLVRHADTNGVHHDHYRDLSPYRDWVIRAFADNLPFDQFVVDQIAGDLHPRPTQDQLIASGFNRLHMIIDVGTALPEESLARNVIDRVTAFGTGFLGLTVHCAVCHDHKYDPIEQKEFFELYAFFNSFDGAPETGGRSGTDFRRGLQKPYIDLPSDEQARELAALEAALAEQAAAVAAAQEAEKAASDDREKQSRKAAREQTEKQHKATRDRRDQLLSTIPAAMIMRELAEPRPAHVFVRGAYDKLGAEVQRDTPDFLPPLPAKDGPRDRLDLARWLVRPDHPLTARVFVNRLWQQFFGIGLVKTAEDLGTQGEWPSHPGLLDHLALRFVESGWDVKALVREIVLSETYLARSSASPEQYLADPDNRLLARGARFRLDAEVVRDQLLATSGLLNRAMYGKSVKPPQPPGIWKAVALPSSYPRTFTPDTGDKILRRSLYTFWKRGMPPPQMTILNAPTREFCTARRERTNTPLQALLLLNEPEYLRAARHLAATTLREAIDPAQRLEVLYETITGRLPDDAERELLLASQRDLQQHYRRQPELAASLLEGSEAPEADAELAAWTMVCSSIYNLDITRSRQ